MNKIVFRVSELEYVIKFLTQLKLIDHESRMRTRFVKLLTSRLQLFMEEYLEVVKEHAQLDSNNEPVIVQVDDQEVYDIKDQAKFQKSLQPLHEEEFVIEVDDNNQNMVKSVTNSILNCGLEFSGQDAYNFDSLCERFENLEFSAQDQ